MSVTLKDIAKRVGFSVTTVSRALAGYDDVAEETRQKILRVAQEVGYYPSTTAQQLRKRRTDTIGLIIPTTGSRFSEPFFTELLTGIAGEAAHHEFELLVSTHPPDSSKEEQAYQRFVRGRRVDGLVVTRTRVDDPRISYLAKQDFPFVVFGRSNLPVDFSYVDVDSQKGSRDITQHLIDLGHRRIACISAPLDLTFANHRLAGYKEALIRNDIPLVENLVVMCDLNQRGGYNAARKLLALETPPTGIVACNDLVGLGAISAARERGLTVGRDIAIVGFDDIPIAEYSHPSLTTVRQPIYEIGHTICRMLIRLIRGEELAERHIILEPRLVIRESSGGHE